MFDSNNFILKEMRTFTNGPVVKALASSSGLWVQFLVGEIGLTRCMAWPKVKKKKKKKRDE